MILFSIIFISSLGLLVYSDSFFSSFHFDDIPYIVNNHAIRDIGNLSNIWNFCPTRFITFFSLALNYHFDRLNVFGYHLVNIFIHLGSAIAVWWLVLLTFATPAMKNEKISRHSHVLALFAALVFVSQPVQTEAVTYIWQRAASLAALFYILSLGSYVKATLLQNERSRIYYILSLVLTVMAMFTKENAVTLPLAVLLYEYCFWGAKDIGWRRALPFFFTLLIIPLTIVLTHSFRFKEIQGVMEGPGGVSPTDYLLTQFRVMMTYVRLAFLPVHLNLDYDYPIFKNIFELPVLTGLAFLIAVLYWAKRLFAKHRLLSFSIFWFFLTLLPESSILPQKDVIFEHRLYLPMVGYCIFLVSGAYYIIGRNSLKATVAVLALVVASYSVMTYERNRVWKSELTLLDDMIKKSPHKARAFNNRGILFDARGELSLALLDFNRAIKADPTDAEAYYNRGIIEDQQGNFTQAIADFSSAIRINPNYAESYNNRGNSYDAKGNALRAIADYTRAIEINPAFADAYANRGLLYFNQGNLTGAISDYNKVIEIKPAFAEAYLDRGTFYDNQKNFSQAMSDYNKAIALEPGLEQAYKYRGLVFFKEGKYPEALIEYDKAIGIDPHDAEAYNDRGSAYGTQGKVQQAVSDFTEAIKINPHYADAYINRAEGYEALKEYGNAWADVNRAKTLGARIDPGLISDLSKASGGD